MRLAYDGSLRASGNISGNTSVSNSDDRIKHNEKSITNAMDIINKLTAKKYFKSNEIHEANYDYTLDESGNPVAPIMGAFGAMNSQKIYFCGTGMLKLPRLVCSQYEKKSPFFFAVCSSATTRS